MGIKFDCAHCGRTLNVKDFLAGKRGICPKCGGRIEIPAATTDDDPAGGTPTSALDGNPAQNMVMAAAAPPMAAGVADPVGVASPVGMTGTVDPIAESPQAKWFVLPAGSTRNYGPALGDAMRQWIREGRVGTDALVWREGWSEWRKAAAAFPQLAAMAVPLEQVPSRSAATPVAIATPVFPALPFAAETPALTGVPGVPVAQPATTAQQPRAQLASVEWATPRVEVAIVSATIPGVPSVMAAGSTGRSAVIRRRSNSARNVTLVVLVLAVVALAIPLIWVLANQ